MDTSQNINYECPNCGSSAISNVYEAKNVPVHSVLLHSSKEEALQYPKRDIWLGFCQNCGFLYNAAFDAKVHEYSAKYEATQGYSATFNAFHQRLAENLIERYDLHDKTIIEIGCGQGEFLTLLCELGGNRGIGFDPAYVPERSMAPKTSQVRFVDDFYSEKYNSEKADFVCCKMTLEHIDQTGEFIKMVARSMQGQAGALVFFQVPNARYVLGETAFWDIYYEHCSYFSPGSLSRLFQSAGFDVLDVWTDYDDQYLMITAQPGSASSANGHWGKNDLAELSQEVASFQEQYYRKVAAWKREIEGAVESGRRIALWGGGSKAVSFLTTLGISSDTIPYAVDINPHKRGTFLAGNGQQVISPEQLSEYQPDVVIVMNPVYCQEIKHQLNQMGLTPEIMTVQSL
jgi:2-polyprenyl-3-methyl-5-hydroxy-6-metoxy-1,4-benzoquinol methylase